jgi:hypothetical protein
MMRTIKGWFCFYVLGYPNVTAHYCGCRTSRRYCCMTDWLTRCDLHEREYREQYRLELSKGIVTSAVVQIQSHY